MPISDVLKFVPAILGLMIPIVYILTLHQRKMAELLNRPQESGTNKADMDALRWEMQELKQLVQQQTIALEGLRKAQLAESALISERVGGGN